MSSLKVDQQLKDVDTVFLMLLGYFMIAVFAMSSYYKLFSNWRAAAISAPAVVMYLYGTRTLKKAIESIKESTNEA
jgi:hypothetical protein